MEIYRHTVEGVSLSEEDIYNLEMWNWALEQNGNEPVFMFARRFGEKFDPEWKEQSFDPCIRAITAFYNDNELKEDSLSNELADIFDTKIFCLNRKMNDAVDEARSLFNAKIAQMKSQDTVKPSYDTEWLFRAFLGITVWDISEKCIERLDELKDSDFYNDGIFSKYHITALDYADEMSLNDFKPEHEYNEYDIEVMLIRIGLYDEETGSFDVDKMKLAEKVKSIVYSDKNRPLKETKHQLEELAKADKYIKCDLAYLYVCAVLEWHLNSIGK